MSAAETGPVPSLRGAVVAVNLAPDHGFSKRPVGRVDLVAGVGVAGDAHAGSTVKHRSRVRVDPSQPNLRQVHLIGTELFDHVSSDGFEVRPGDLGENVTTVGIELARLPVGATLRIGPEALVVLTGLRNPCPQIDGFAAGLRTPLAVKDDEGELLGLAGVMAMVVQSGPVADGDPIDVALPPGPTERLRRV